jgi:hypothetical protein
MYFAKRPESQLHLYELFCLLPRSVDIVRLGVTEIVQYQLGNCGRDGKSVCHTRSARGPRDVPRPPICDLSLVVLMALVTAVPAEVDDFAAEMDNRASRRSVVAVRGYFTSFAGHDTDSIG